MSNDPAAAAALNMKRKAKIAFGLAIPFAAFFVFGWTERGSRILCPIDPHADYTGVTDICKQAVALPFRLGLAPCLLLLFTGCGLLIGASRQTGETQNAPSQPRSTRAENQTLALWVIPLVLALLVSAVTKTPSYWQMPGIIFGMMFAYALDSEVALVLATVLVNAVIYRWLLQLIVWSWKRTLAGRTSR